MSKEEVILDIVEKTYDQIQEVKREVVDIKIQQALHDSVVKAHEARSTALQELVIEVKKDTDLRVKTLEKDAQFFRNFVKFATVTAAILAFYVEVLHPYFLK